MSSSCGVASEGSCAGAPGLPGLAEGFEDSHEASPPPSSLTETDPFSPPTYPLVFPLSSSLALSARFPPPPGSSFVQPAPDVTYCANSNYPPESHSAFDRWSDRTFATAYGEGILPKQFSQWAFPAFDSGGNNNKGNSSSLGDFRPVAPYPSRDSLASFGTNLPSLPNDSLAFPNVAVMASNSSAPIAAALPSGHLTAFLPTNQPVEFPHSSSRFPFNPHAPTFVPAVLATSTFGFDNAEYGPGPVTSYMSRPGSLLSSGTVQAPSHFLGASPGRTRSHDSTLGSEFSSGFVESHYLEGDPVIENSDFAAASNQPYPPPLSEALFSSFPSATAVEQSSAMNVTGSPSPQNEQKRADWIAMDAGKLNYQHMSVDEWRWMQYQRMVIDELGSSTNSRRVYPPRYGSFPGSVEYLDSNSCHGLEGKHENDSSGQRDQKSWLPSSKGISWACNAAVPETGNILESKDVLSLGPLMLGQPNDEGEQFVEHDSSQWDSEFVLHNSCDASGNTRDRSLLDKTTDQKEPHERQAFLKADNHSHPSLKEAASALAEALSWPEFPVRDAASSHQNAMQGMLDDHCSSTGSSMGHKDVKDRHRFGDGDFVLDGYTSRGQQLHSPTRNKRDIHSQIEDAFCEFRGAPATWAVPRAADHSPTSAQPRQKNFLDGMLQSTKGGPLRTVGQPKIFSNASPGIMRQPLLPLGSASGYGVNGKSVASDNLNSVFTQALNPCTTSQLGMTKSLMSQNSGGESLDDAKSLDAITPPLKATSSSFAPLDSHDGLPVSWVPSGIMCLSPSRLDGLPDNFPTFGPSPLFSQSYPETHEPMNGKCSTTISKTIVDSNSVSPDIPFEPGFKSFGTGVQSLAASISNLTKVLCSLNTLSVPPADIKELVQNVQSSILRLSECLLLEQLGGNEESSSSLHKTDISSANKHEKGESPCQTLGKAQRTVSEGPGVACHGQDTHPDMAGHNSGVKLPITLADLVSGVRVATPNVGAIPERADSSHQPFTPGEDLLGGLKSAELSTGGSVLRKNSEDMASASILGMISDYEMGDNGVIDRSFLERIVTAATERETKLKAHVEELEEQLEQERAENKGTAFLCEKILQEAEAGKGKAVRWNSEVVIDHDLNRKSESNLDSLNTNVNHNSRTSSKTEASAFMDYSKTIGCNRADPGDGRDLGYLQQANSRDQDSKNHLQGSLRGTPPEGASRILGDYGARSVSPSGSKGLALNGEQRDPHAQPDLAPVLPWGSLHEISNSVEARLELLRARSEGAASLNSSHDTWGDLEFRLPDTSPISSSPVSWHETNTDRTPGTPQCEPLTQSAIVDPQGPICNPFHLDAEESSTARESRAKAGHNLEPRGAGLNSAVSDLEVRLALLQRRPSYPGGVDNFTYLTKSCTTGECETANSEVRGVGPIGTAPTGAHEELAAKALEFMSHIKSQLLIQSEAISNMRTLWGQFSEQANSKTGDMMSSSGVEFPQKEGGNESCFSSSILNSDTIENGLVTSRDSWNGDHGPGPEDFLGAETCKLSSSTSGNARCDAGKFEASSEVSLVRLLDSDIETAVSLLPTQQHREHSYNPEMSAASLARLLDLSIETAVSSMPTQSNVESDASPIPIQKQRTDSSGTEKSEVEFAALRIATQGQSKHSSDKAKSDVKTPASLIPNYGSNTHSSDPEMSDAENTVEKTVVLIPTQHQMTYSSDTEKSAARNGLWGEFEEGGLGSRTSSSNSQDAEDETSWEHVCHPRDESD